MIRLDIISDPICPWCYIGKARLDRALEMKGENPFDIHWRAFQLNPEMPPGGMDRQEYLDTKFGVEGAKTFYKRIEDTAIASGLAVRFDRIKRTPNTIDAHRLIRWARPEGKQNALVMDLFRRYFEEGEDISDAKVLGDAGHAAGLDPDVVARLLASDNDTEEVRQEDAGFREMGVSGVPTFIIGGKYVVNGAQETDLWCRVIDDLQSQAESGVAALS